MTVRPPVPKTWIRGPADVLAIAEGCWFDEEAGRYVCDFLETFCKQSKGRKWAGQPIRLLPWQRDFLMRLFGWRRPDGTRRYRTAYLEIPKKNGKSTLISGLALFLLVADGEPGAEVYCLAYDGKQARVVFDEAARMVRKSPDLAGILEITDSADTITFPANDGKIEALSKEVASKDGVNASGVLFDELHRQRDRLMWDIFEFSGAGRDQPLRVSITTAGDRKDSICWEQRKYSIDVNEGTVKDTTHLGVIYGADPTDDLDDPRVWREANPSMGVTIVEEDFARELAAARRKGPGPWKNFKRLRLGLWGESAEKFMAAGAWEACGDSGLQLPPEGTRCYGGLDLASTEDLAAHAMLFPLLDDQDEPYLAAFVHFWLPEEAAERAELERGIPYGAWAEAGWITLTPGSRIDYRAIRRELARRHSLWPLVRGYSDPHNATHLVGDELRDEDGQPWEFLSQGTYSLNAPTKEFERLVTVRGIRHQAGPVLDWCVGNAVVVRDRMGNVRPDKQKSPEKIDGLVATINALAAYIAGDDEDETVIEYSGGLEL